jgi:carotenoid cleavage dioxygenase
VDLASGVVSETRLDDTPQEFPRVDERRVGRRSRYGYTVGSARTTETDGTAPAVIIKHDLELGTSRTVGFGVGREPGEFVFVPDAQTLDTVATIGVPARVPHGFHGNWVPQES